MNFRATEFTAYQLWQVTLGKSLPLCATVNSSVTWRSPPLHGAVLSVE